MYQTYEVSRERLLELIAAELKFKALARDLPDRDVYYFILDNYIDDYFGEEGAYHNYGFKDIALEYIDECFNGIEGE